MLSCRAGYYITEKQREGSSARIISLMMWRFINFHSFLFIRQYRYNR